MIVKQVTARRDPPQVYVVLGMHRSATSAAAFALHQIGIEMNGGKFHCEDLDIMRLNDRILKAAGGTWDTPPRRSAILGVEQLFRDEIAYLVALRYKQARQAEGKWGFKDPRVCLTYDLWRPSLVKPILLVMYRDVEQVAASLRKRNGFSIDFGIALAQEYNRRISGILEREGLC